MNRITREELLALIGLAVLCTYAPIVIAAEAAINLAIGAGQ